MRFFNTLLAVVEGGLLALATLASADVKVDQQPLGPDGRLGGGVISPDGLHAAVLATKGSRYVVLIDGVAGPVIEQLMSTLSSPYTASTFWGGTVPILYSNDGSHCAYIGKSGDQYVVYLDGKELVRGPITSSAQLTVPLTFSPGGKHLFFMDQDPSGLSRIVVDGTPGPGFHFASALTISPDGEHYAYVTYTSQGTNPFSVVDGKQVNYFGDNLQYTGRNVLLSVMNLGNSATGLLINGKPEIKAMQLTPMWISPDGKQLAIVITPNNTSPPFLTVNGKVIDGTQGLNIEKVYFSPDGKRWAALCHTKTGSKFMMIDGKKMQEYPTIPPTVVDANAQNHWRFVTNRQNTADFSDLQPPVPGFTPDSSKFVYVASTNSQMFAEIEDQESDGYLNTGTFAPTLSPVGHRVGFLGSAPNHATHAVVDDKDMTVNGSVSGTTTAATAMTFSPDGSHYAFVAGPLYLDGVAQPGTYARNYLFSPDSKHIAYQATVNNNTAWLVDGKVVCPQGGSVQRVFFSPDSQHIGWVTRGRVENSKDSLTLFLDGKSATHFETAINGSPDNFVFAPDGTVSFISLTDGNLRRFKLTPSADMNLTALLAASPDGK